MLTKETRMTSASRFANDLLSPVHRTIRMGMTKHLENMLTLDLPVSHIDAKDGLGFTPLELAVVKAAETPEFAHVLVRAGADITLPCLGYPNALLATVRRADFKLALFIVQEARPQVCKIVNDRDAEGLSPLLLVARFKAESHSPEAAFENSSEFNQEALCLALVACGAGVKMYTNAENLTTLHFAARHNVLALVERLIDEKADTNALDSRGWTPLHEAVMAGYLPDIVAALIVGGADPGIASRSGITPLGLAQGWQKLAEDGRLSYRGGTVTIDEADREVASREVNSLLSMLKSVSTTSEDKTTAEDSTTIEHSAPAEASTPAEASATSGDSDMAAD